MYLIFDTETSGLPNKFLPPNDANQARVVQLAAVMLDSTYKEVASLNCLIRPEGFNISKEAENIHGISKVKAMQFGVSSVSAIKLFVEFAKGAHKIIAHNIKFDKTLLDIEFSNHNITFAWMESKMFCTMLSTTNICKLPKKVNGGFKWPKLSEAYRHFFNEELVNGHDALTDVRATARIFKHLVESKQIMA